MLKEHTCQHKTRQARDAEPTEEAIAPEATRTGDTCGQRLDALGDHAINCSRGGGYYRLHGGMERWLEAVAKECKLEAQLESVVPELLQGEPGSDEAVEARLDVVIFSPGPEPHEYYVDVAHVHPWSTRAQTSMRTWEVRQRYASKSGSGGAMGEAWVESQ